MSALRRETDLLGWFYAAIVCGVGSPSCWRSYRARLGARRQSREQYNTKRAPLPSQVAKGEASVTLQSCCVWEGSMARQPRHRAKKKPKRARSKPIKLSSQSWYAQAAKSIAISVRDQ